MLKLRAHSAAGSHANSLFRRTRTAIRHGWKNSFDALVYKIRHRRWKTDIIGFYDFIRQRPVGTLLEPGMVARNTVNWVVPALNAGSGGLLNIFRFIHHLEKDGFDCRVIILGEPRTVSAEQASKRINDWFFPVRCQIYLSMETAPPAHVSVATSWTTAYHVRNFLPTAHRCYFVQDFEPYFYASGSEYVWAEATYRFGFIGITAGTWLKNKLQTEYGMRAEAFGFACDRDRYSPHERREPEIRRVFFYGRPPTPRRAFEMGLLVLDEVVCRLPDVKVVFAGWDVSGYHIPFEHCNAGIVDLDDLPDLYSQCDVALVLSFSNVSLLPLELMACGTPVVSNRAPYTEWLLNDGNSYLTEPTVNDLADALCIVLTDPVERERLRAGGLRTAATSDWRCEIRKVGEILESLGDEGAAP
jgi:glycosyltransferase involved in cell wall biosynthesis